MEFRALRRMMRSRFYQTFVRLIVLADIASFLRLSLWWILAAPYPKAFPCLLHSRRRILPGLALASVASWSIAQQPAPPKLIEETHGNVTNLSADGQLSPTRQLGCVTPDDMTTDETPPDVYTGVRSCIARGDYDHAAELFAMAGAFGAFDGQRVADVSARDAPQVLAYLLSGSLSAGTARRRSARAVARIGTDAAMHRQVCTAASKVGAADVPADLHDPPRHERHRRGPQRRPIRWSRGSTRPRPGRASARSTSGVRHDGRACHPCDLPSSTSRPLFVTSQS